jgi:hypothetical protein
LVGRWVAKLGRWVAKLVPRLLPTAALWVRIQIPDIFQKYKIGEIPKEWPTHSSPPKLRENWIFIRKKP